MSLEARRNPVNQAAVAFYRLAALITAVLLASAGAPGIIALAGNR